MTTWAVIYKLLGVMGNYTLYFQSPQKVFFWVSLRGLNVSESS